ncbi:MAG: alpha/beta hydrolase fold domain-containing protein, partial [Acidaminococcaceae bacterium]|nr:alpha/beta hydrolase fold domain-containing protein [Acidaminococcaceae bacterium]
MLGKGTPLYIPVKEARYKGKLDRKDPRLSPIYADLSGLAPILIHAGGNELFLTESVKLAEKAAA